jgi:hypothetical protein
MEPKSETGVTPSVSTITGYADTAGSADTVKNLQFNHFVFLEADPTNTIILNKGTLTVGGSLSTVDLLIMVPCFVKSK